MILGHDILSKLNINVILYNKNIRVNGGTHNGCTAPMKEIPKLNHYLLSDRLKEKYFVTKNSGRVNM